MSALRAYRRQTLHGDPQSGSMPLRWDLLVIRVGTTRESTVRTENVLLHHHGIPFSPKSQNDSTFCFSNFLNFTIFSVLRQGRISPSAFLGLHVV